MLDVVREPDPLCMPDTGEGPEERLARACALASTAGAAYVERRGVPSSVADAAGVRFDGSFAGRPAVVVAMRDRDGNVASLHGRYLTVTRGQDKMLTIGPGGGAVSVLEGWRGDPLVLVEGLFDALSLATCGFACVATIGRWAPWLVPVCEGRTVWLAFDAGRAGEREVARVEASLRGADVRRLSPPGRSKDWSTALVKLGRTAIASRLEQAMLRGPLR
jgi:hypothetical protein